MVRRRNSLLILECISKVKEKLSEGLLLELMRILGFEEQIEIKIMGGPNRLVDSFVEPLHNASLKPSYTCRRS